MRYLRMLCDRCSLLHAEYLRVTTELLPRLGDLKFPWICFHGEGAHVAYVTWVVVMRKLPDTLQRILLQLDLINVVSCYTCR
jgi:hypothetical protein